MAENHFKCTQRSDIILSEFDVVDEINKRIRVGFLVCACEGTLTKAFSEVRKILVTDGIDCHDFSGKRLNESTCFIKCTIYGDKALALIEQDV